MSICYLINLTTLINQKDKVTQLGNLVIYITILTIYVSNELKSQKEKYWKKKI